MLVAAVALALVVTGPAATPSATPSGIGSTAVTVWNIAKWPVILLVVVLVVAVLYWATPNVKQPKFRWISVGALLAIVVWIVASALFGVYVATFSSYNKTYGALAGVVVFLLWLWITNLALLFGAELDSELERARELQAGLPAEETLQLPPRDTRKIDKQEEKEAADVARGRELRESRGERTARETPTRGARGRSPRRAGASGSRPRCRRRGGSGPASAAATRCARRRGPSRRGRSSSGRGTRRRARRRRGRSRSS